MIEVREATIGDVEGIRDVYHAEYGDHYAYPQYYDADELARLTYAEDSIMLVAVDDESGRVAGTASVVFSVGAHDDLVGEFGRLVVHPDCRGQGIGGRLMEGRIERVKSRLHIGIVENRAAHVFSQKISERHGFVAVGLVPGKLLLERREAVALYLRHFANALELRRNNPRIIPEAALLAGFSLDRCGLPRDMIIDDSSAPFPHDDAFELEELTTQGYASLLRIERGRLEHREVFGPIRLHYGVFQLKARHSHYLIARRDGQVIGGVGYMIDHAEKAVRVFELISTCDEPIRFLLTTLLRRCQAVHQTEFVEVDVSAYAPRMQRTLLELGFIPVGYIPANVFDRVERLDAVKMVQLLVPLSVDKLCFTDQMQSIADVVLERFGACKVLPRIDSAARRSPLFDGLNDEQRHRLLGVCQPHAYRPGETIFKAGDRGGAVHLIFSGQVELRSESGHAIGCVETGQCLGETALLCEPSAPTLHSLDAVACTSLETAAFSSSQLHELIRRRPDIGVVLFRNLAADVSGKLKNACPPSTTD